MMDVFNKKEHTNSKNQTPSQTTVHSKSSGGWIYLQPIADRVALNLKIIFKTFSTNQNSAYGIYD